MDSLSFSSTERPHCRVFSCGVMPMVEDIATGVFTRVQRPENACVTRDECKVGSLYFLYAGLNGGLMPHRRPKTVPRSTRQCDSTRIEP